MKIAVVIVVAAYIGVSMIAFRFANPQLTETQLFMRIPDALMWRQ